MLTILLFSLSDSSCTSEAIGCEKFPTDWCMNNNCVKTFYGTVNKHGVPTLGRMDFSPSAQSLGIRPVLTHGCDVVLRRCFGRGMWLCNSIKQFLGH